MHRTKQEKIAAWIDGSTATDYTFGSLQLRGTRVYTYDVLLARVNRADRVVHLNTKKYSHTSTVHLGLMKTAAYQVGYRVTDHSEESTLFVL